MRVVLAAGVPIGFAMLGPILDGVGLLHLYLAQAARGRLAELTPLLVQAAQDLKPALKLAVSSPTPAWARLHRQVLAPLGFREHTLFVR